MKTKNVILFLCFIIMVFQSCIPSLHPLYTKDKLVMKKELEGTWMDMEDSRVENVTFSSAGVPIAIDSTKDIPGIWIFEARDDKSFNFTYYDEDGRPGYFEAHLIKLGDNHYLNFYPDNSYDYHEGSDLSNEKFNSFEVFHYMPVNTFAKISFDPGGVSIALFDGEFIKKLLDQKRIRIKHEEMSDGSYLLTAQPEELQQFILKYGDDEKAFPDPISLRKPS